MIYLKILLLSVLCAIMLACQLPPPVSRLREADLSRSVVMIVYHPYGPALERCLAIPLPDYSGWTDDRMERDFNRLKATGVDVALVGIEAEKMSDHSRLERYRRLLELRAMNVDWPDLAFFIDFSEVDWSDAHRSETVSAWLLDLNMPHHPGIFQVAGRPLVVLVSHERITYRHPAFHSVIALPFPERVNEWRWQPGNSKWAAASPDGRQAWLQVGWLDREETEPERQWRRRRRDGANPVRWALREGLLLEPRFVVINSWNNYLDGSFVEPTRADGDRASQILQREISHLRRLRSD